MDERSSFDVKRICHSDGYCWYIAAGVANTMFFTAYYAGLTIAPISMVTPLVQTSPLFVAGLSSLFFSDLENIIRYVVGDVLLIVCGAILISIVTWCDASVTVSF